MSRGLIPSKNNELILQVNGISYKGFTDATFSRSIENLTGQFNFSTTVKENNNAIIQADIRCQDEVKIFIDDTKLLTGYIEDLDINYSANSHSITFAGRDKTGDLLDSSILKKEYRIKNFQRLVEVVLKDNGFTKIKVFNDVGDLNLRNYDPDKDAFVVQNSDTILSFLDKYAQKLQVLLITDEEGDIRITREGSDLSLGSINSAIGNPNNNVLSASINVSTTERFRTIELQSQQGDQFQNDQLNQSATATDSVIRATRKRIISYDISSEELTLKELAKWNINMRRARGLRYNCTLQGFYEQRDKGFIWQPNTLVTVQDDKCQLSGQFLIQGVTYRKSNEGTFTDLSIVNKGAFSTKTSQQLSYTPSGKFGDTLIRSA